MDRVIALLLLSSVLSPAARADFVVTGTPSPLAPLQELPQASTMPFQGVANLERAPQPVRFKPASGFGYQVPLAFAIRQIVPPDVAVTYGPGANADALVSWKGGAPWNEVLRASVKPLGLRVLLTTGAIQIRK